ncbi:predicted protein [Sclerotinia sclerotiorum 1980 UF-70]|uniref:Uncharacterized protein n=1 Tax=Sclerotinia sclerotiorum (strain ATCC 18683 / 1980 / Ss-1) TaxID=665079 RepID=A7F0M3_SCLS1|nr:predicted protein [Sclerotinia sclerotiorum 1980 UF-70]EDN95265.1 predicted protein [Sclerotinia sclerotiorum 1980 UF-70]
MTPTLHVDSTRMRISPIVCGSTIIVRGHGTENITSYWNRANALRGPTRP